MDIKLTLYMRTDETVRDALERVKAYDSGVDQIEIVDQDEWKEIYELRDEIRKLKAEKEAEAKRQAELENEVNTLRVQCDSCREAVNQYKSKYGALYQPF